MFTRHLLIGILATVGIGCGRPDAGNFPGSYKGTISFVYLSSNRTASAASAIKIDQGSMADLAVDVSQAAGFACILDADRDGDKATMRPGSECSGIFEDQLNKIKVSTGTVTLGGTTLQLTWKVDLETTGYGGKISTQSVQVFFAGTKQ